MDIVTIKIPRAVPIEDLERVEKRIETKLKDAGWADFVVIAASDGVEISVMKV